MKKIRLAFIIFTILFVSCNEQKIEIKNHKIADLNSKFPLPTNFMQISGDKVMDMVKDNNAPNNEALAYKMNTKQTHFINRNDEQNLISITNAIPKLEIEQNFLNGFSQMIEEETFNSLSKISNHKMIEKKFLKSDTNKALKVKFEYNSQTDNKYFTLFLITTTNQSFIVTNYSNDKSDIQNMVVEYLRKN